jgi:hypothetical protein
MMLRPAGQTEGSGARLSVWGTSVVNSDTAVWGGKAVWGAATPGADGTMFDLRGVWGERGVWGTRGVWGMRGVWGATSDDTLSANAASIDGEQ